MKKITGKLIKLMQTKGLSQSDLARIAGVSEASVSAWMKGSKPRSRYLLRISKHYNIDPATLEDDKKELSFETVPPPKIKPLSEVKSIFDEEMECNVKEILEIYSDLLDQLDRNEKLEPSSELATQDVLQSLFFSIVRNTTYLANTLMKLYNVFPDKQQAFGDKISNVITSIQTSSFILGACAQGVSAEKLRNVIHGLQRNSQF